MDVPRSVATCPDCDGTLYIEVDEWEADTGIPTDTGTKAYCQHDHAGSQASQMPYVYWLPIDVRVHRWAAQYVRVVDDPCCSLVPTSEYERRRDLAKLSAWEVWARQDDR